MWLPYCPSRYSLAWELAWNGFSRRFICEIPYILLIGFIAYFFGLGPGIVALTLATLGFDYAYITPKYSLAIGAQSTAEWVQIAMFLLGCVVALLAMASLHDSKQRLAQRTESLEAEIREREQAQDEIRKLNAELEQRVVERTSQLQQTVETLENEIGERLAAEERLDTALEQEKRARADAGAAESRVKSILEMAPDGIIIASEDGSISLREQPGGADVRLQAPRPPRQAD